MPEALSSARFEIVLLEDNPDHQSLIKNELEARQIIVHEFEDGRLALEKIVNDPNIGAFVADIEIQYPYGSYNLTGPQGYDVANDIPRRSANRLLSVIVLTILDPDRADEEKNKLLVRYQSFSKFNWMKHNNDGAKVSEAFNRLALLIKNSINLTPSRWYEETRQLHSKSRWVREQKDGIKTYPPYWHLYRNLWFSPDWKKYEQEICERASKIVQGYLSGDTLKLRGGHLNLTENPSEIEFMDQLVGRRVVYALKALEPAYWGKMVCGQTPEEEKAAIDPETWNAILSAEVRSLVNQLNSHSAKNHLEEKYKRLQEITKTVEDLEIKSQDSSSYYREFLTEQKKLEKELRSAKEPVLPAAILLAKALQEEHEEIRQTFVPYLRFWNLDFSEIDWAKKTKSDERGSLKQMLLVLGIRTDDIAHEDIENWKLLLPEERKWLFEFVSKH